MLKYASFYILLSLGILKRGTENNNYILIINNDQQKYVTFKAGYKEIKPTSRLTTESFLKLK
jgi:hypothetical protein